MDITNTSLLLRKGRFIYLHAYISLFVISLTRNCNVNASRSTRKEIFKRAIMTSDISSNQDRGSYLRFNQRQIISSSFINIRTNFGDFFFYCHFVRNDADQTNLIFSRLFFFFSCLFSASTGVCNLSPFVEMN